jgi:cytochrome P450
MSALLFNPRDPGFNSDPYTHYRRLREEDPVHRSPLGVWFLGRYEDVRLVLKDSRFAVKNIPAQIAKKSDILQRMRLSANQPRDLTALYANSRHWLSFIEPPDHTRIRRLVSRAFHQRSVEGLRVEARDCARRLIEELRPRGGMDLISDFARVLPSRMIARLLGVPSSDLPLLVRLTEQISRILDPLMSLEEYGLLDRASRDFSAYLQQLIDSRRAAPRDDLITALLEAQDERDALDDEEMISTCILLFAAGSETTVNLIGNGMLALLRDTQRMSDLVADPGLAPQAIEEFLRYDAPLQMTSRVALQDVQIGEKVIRCGDQVYAVVGSANRDPRVFENPDELCFQRERNHHLAFAAGHHLCLGAPLARIEGQEAIVALLELLPDMRLACTEVRWRAHIVLRGLASLPVQFAAA